MTNDTLLIAELAAQEGSRSKPYRDTAGKLTVGIGRNLDDVGVSQDEIRLMLDNDIARARAALDKALPWWRTLSDGRQRVLANMCFNMGIDRLLGFTHMLKFCQAGDYNSAASEMLSSKWAQEVGDRATYLARLMRVGENNPQA